MRPCPRGWANFCPLEAFKEAVSQDALDISVWFHTSTTPNRLLLAGGGLGGWLGRGLLDLHDV